jgi:biopolymer transport protein ExbB
MAAVMVLGLAFTLAADIRAQGGDDAPVIGATADSAEAGAPADGAAPTGEEGETAKGQYTFQDLWGFGGNTMWLLAALSVCVLAFIFERLISLRGSAVIPSGFMRKLMAHWTSQDLSRVIALCASSQSSIARVLRAGLFHFEEGIARMEDAVEAAGDHEATMLRRNLGVIAALGNIATMVGLLGTVIGMIDAFQIIAAAGTGDAALVAGGIFKALITTAGGLIIGITAIGSHAFLRRRVEVLEINLKETSFRLLEDLMRPVEPAAPKASESAPAKERALKPAEA